MPECFKVVCIPCKVLYKCSALPLIKHTKRERERENVDLKNAWCSTAACHSLLAMLYFILYLYGERVCSLGFYTHHNSTQSTPAVKSTWSYCTNSASKAMKCHTLYSGSHSFACHQTRVIPAFIPSHRASPPFGWYSLHLATDAELTTG